MKKTILLTALLLIACGLAYAEEWEKYDKPVPTKIIIRVLSHGAKAMNQHTGSLIVIRDARTGKELDRGTVEGATGDDTALMKTGYPRITGQMGLLKGEKGFIAGDPNPVVYESKVDTASYETSIGLTKPTQLVIEAYGPLMPRHAMSSAITSVWAFPGEDITGEGIVLVLRGLIVDTLASLSEKEINVEDVKEGITVPFYMRMMCGCPIAPEGKTSWNAEKYKITTQAYYNGKLYHEDVTTSDKLLVDASAFKTKVPLPKGLPEGPFKKEKVKIRVMAAQAEQNNFGVQDINVYLTKDK